jgi:FdrA protein
MEIRVVVKKDTYYDSVTLMLVSGKVTALDGVTEAVVAMGTPMNKELLQNVGMFTDAVNEAKADDLIIAIKAADQDICERAVTLAEEAMAKKAADRTKDGIIAAATIGSAVIRMPQANLAIISVPGAYAAREAMQALKNGLHVMMFSDNVSVTDELTLKRYAHEKGLLMMGPDCGTAIINGTGLCFSNAVTKGSIGIVGASGTGTQEVCVLIDRFGGGLSQVLGTGGRDLTEEVGGIMMLDCLAALEQDTETKVIVLISKQPAKAVAYKVLAEIKRVTKPVVVCFINGEHSEIEKAGGHFARTLEEAAYNAVKLAKKENQVDILNKEYSLSETAAGLTELQTGQKYIRGLFCGGTLCDEAMHLVKEKVGKVYSNIAKQPEFKLQDPNLSKEHTFIDLGDDAFTIGKPHPMIDPSLRLPRILQEAKDPEVAVILFDVVLGFGSHEDPAGITLPVITEAKQIAKQAGRNLEFVAYVCGTTKDPQDRQKQEQKLAAAGVKLAPSNAKAAYLAAAILAR